MLVLLFTTPSLLIQDLSTHTIPSNLISKLTYSLHFCEFLPPNNNIHAYCIDIIKVDVYVEITLHYITAVYKVYRQGQMMAVLLAETSDQFEWDVVDSGVVNEVHAWTSSPPR